jgi:hypothetical protein
MAKFNTEIKTVATFWCDKVFKPRLPKTKRIKTKKPKTVRKDKISLEINDV